MSKIILKTQPADVFAPVHIDSWDDYCFLVDKLFGWIFRGQDHYEWGLQPSLERECHAIGWANGTANAERIILNSFKKRFQEILDINGLQWSKNLPKGTNSIPHEADIIAWLSLIQHFGGPTRLLDFTRSSQVAAYFAYENASNETIPIVWAVKESWFHRLLQKQLQTQLGIPFQNSIQGGNRFNIVFGHELHGFAVDIVEPENPSARQQKQQGLFLASLNLDYTFEENLYGMVGLDPKQMEQLHQMGSYNSPRVPNFLEKLNYISVIKMVLNRDCRIDILNTLAKDGITRFGLFPNFDGSPSLDGLAGTMKHELLRPNSEKSNLATT
jgi:hypothetical protein